MRLPTHCTWPRKTAKLSLLLLPFAQHEHQVVDMREPRAQGVEQHPHDLGKRLGVLAVAPVQAVK